jgi:prolipoprotein diacylglyceryltransferase
MGARLSVLADSMLHTLQPFALQFGNGFGVRWYGISYAAGFLVAWLIMRWMSLTRRTPLSVDQVGDFLTWLIGGVLIGLGAVILMAFNGRIAGMTAMLGGVLEPQKADNRWRLAFLAGAIAAPLIATLLGAEFSFAAPTTGIALAIGGVIVGIGVTYGSGCTSGHGVCGLARLSPRSFVATATFMVTTFATVTLIRHGFGG